MRDLPRLLVRLLAVPLHTWTAAYEAADRAWNPWNRPDPRAWIDARIAAEPDPGKRAAWRIIRHTHEADGLITYTPRSHS